MKSVDHEIFILGPVVVIILAGVLLFLNETNRLTGEMPAYVPFVAMYAMYVLGRIVGERKEKTDRKVE